MGDFEGIVGSIIALIFIGIVLSAIIPAIVSISGNDKQSEINKLNEQISDLQGEINSKNIQIDQLQSKISAMDQNITEKDNRISDLTGQLGQKDLIITDLNSQLNYYSEKEYLREINNNYYSISNYFEKIENKFFPIEISISLISLTLFAFIVKEFALINWFKNLWQRIKKKKEGIINENDKV